MCAQLCGMGGEDGQRMGQMVVLQAKCMAIACSWLWNADMSGCGQ